LQAPSSRPAWWWSRSSSRAASSSATPAAVPTAMPALCAGLSAPFAGASRDGQDVLFGGRPARRKMLPLRVVRSVRSSAGSRMLQVAGGGGGCHTAAETVRCQSVLPGAREIASFHTACTHMELME
jgi:hypothetical protein